ncbi:glycoside hydrolase family 3 N-terminal domain-containing protein [Desulfobulbus alkaliphilus]|uniref:glycoside hydrolase family 3 N-terminal domain-containing protein n=1 Tax=Desulfobulbus alkaliphilus TaxID=869814 RepID=UPI001966922C|nr:glycoside hydrolase family 3 N-terminal domain-containing protein [Desulfobulbus alkaliphilus]MBM9537193.1 hypothetical protein [Desulfobulbus alkaliphilus]
MGNRLPTGQMLLIGFRGCRIAPDHWLVDVIRNHGLGGVILFDRNVDGSVQNIVSPSQLRQLTASLQGYAETRLFIAVDQEGGRVCRLKERDGFSPSMSAAEQAKLAETEKGPFLDYQRNAAAMLATHGINLNFAPVVDLDLNPHNPIIGRYGRSFGAKAERVSTYASLFVTAHHQHGVGCCLKHFPGHGSAGGDSHLGFVDSTDHWLATELNPYQWLVAGGYSDGIMTAHLVNRHLDPSAMPATLSSAMVEGILRRQIGFNGVVFSDDLQMRAISNGWGYREAVQRAVLAGVDVLVVGNNLALQPDAVQVAVQAIDELLDSGRINEKRIADSLARIALFKKYMTGQQPWPSSNPPTI